MHLHPEGTEAVAEQVKTVPVYTPELGVIVASTSKAGALLMMVTVAVSLTKALLLSVKETEHSITSEGLDIEESN